MDRRKISDFHLLFIGRNEGNKIKVVSWYNTGHSTEKRLLQIISHYFHIAFFCINNEKFPQPQIKIKYIIAIPHIHPTFSNEIWLRRTVSQNLEGGCRMGLQLFCIVLGNMAFLTKHRLYSLYELLYYCIDVNSLYCI